MPSTMAREGRLCRDEEQNGSQERVREWWGEVADSLWPELTGVNLRDSASRVELLSGR